MSRFVRRYHRRLYSAGNRAGRIRTADLLTPSRRDIKTDPHSQTGIGGSYTASAASPESTISQPESTILCRDAKGDAKPQRLSNAQRLIDRGVEPDVADFLVRCARRERVVHVVEQFDQLQHCPADPGAWFQEMVLHDSHDRNVSKFGQQIRQAPKSSGPPRRQPLPKRRRRRSRTRKLRRPAA